MGTLGTYLTVGNNQMLIPDQEHKTEIKHYQCPYHRQHPGAETYPGCTCHSSVVQRMASMSEMVSYDVSEGMIDEM